MNAKRISLILMVVAVMLSACASATAAPVNMAQATQQSSKQGYTNAPAATQPPASLPMATQIVQQVVTAAPTSAAAAQAPVAIGSSAGQPPVYLPPAPTPTPYSAEATAAPADVTFQNYGVNPFVDTHVDHLSTFGLDVDTASYSVARSYLQQGSMPPADAIRVEEFVNYFRQDYPTPQNVAFGLYADGAPSPFQRDGTIYLRFGVQGYQVPESQRKPLSLTFVIDVSGSMAEQNRLELVKQSLQLLVDRLGPADQVTIIAYTTNAWVVLNPTRGDQHAAILNAINGLYPMNTTNVAAGLTLGYQTAMQAYRKDATNRVILASDGVANVGATSPDSILALVQGYVKEGITLTAIGVGMGNYNDALLEQLADKGNGNYAYVDTLDEARKVFVEDMVSTLQVIAMDAKVQVDFNSDVVSYYRQIGYEKRAIADQDFRNDRVDAGEIGAGHHVTALYAVQLRPNAQGRIATVQLRWKDPATYQATEINGNFNTWDLSRSYNEASARYRLSVLTAQFAELLRQSPWAADTTYAQLSGYVSRLQADLPEDSDVAELAGLISQAARISPWGR